VDLIDLHKNIIDETTQKAKQPFFLYLHYIGIHTKIIETVAKKYSDFDKDYFNNYESNKENYNQYLEGAALYLETILNHCKSLEITKNTLIVVTSDHGVSNGERLGEKVYGTFTYDYTIKSFSFFMAPNFTNYIEIPDQVRTIDITPTILNYFNIKRDPKYDSLQGRSLLPWITRGYGNNSRIAFCETGGLNGPFPSPDAPNVRCVRGGRWKLIHNLTPKTYELYDLEKDRNESNNLFGKCPEIEKKLMFQLQSIIDDCADMNFEL